MRSALVRTDRYSQTAIAFHWTLAVLIIFNLVIALFHETLLDDVRWVMPVHKALGITILVLTLGRIGWRLMHRPPPMSPELPRWERGLAKLVHALFYVLMLGVPLTGWAMVSAAEVLRPLTWFWLFDIPYLPVSTAVREPAHASHALLGYLMTGLVALHILAALRHQFILRDKVVGRMSPLR